MDCYYLPIILYSLNIGLDIGLCLIFFIEHKKQASLGWFVAALAWTVALLNYLP